jgi:hypothetical protein
MSKKDKKSFTFEISLSVLNHLGRSLYRSFATVLGEAISNAWDADAKNVWIYVERDKDRFFIKDDGIGMSADDFQEKFLKIGYSKRKGQKQKSKRGRPFIGRKGIGKLALLSCAKKITVISKTRGKDYIGGVIDNSGLDKAITEDLTPKQYPLGAYKLSAFKDLTKGHTQGTIIYFEDIKDGVRNSFDFLTKIVALYFRFSLVDKSFNIFLNDEKITHKHLDDLAKNTQFLWEIGDSRDPFIEGIKKDFLKDKEKHETKKIRVPGIKGFLSSVQKPRNLKIMTTDERVGVDLFVNGRIRERDILKHIPTARIVESYLYGQIHFDGLDEADADRFTSSREGIVADDPKYNKFLGQLRKVLLEVAEDWDKWRIKHREEGDPENTRLTPKDRASRGLFNVISKDFDLSKGSKNKAKIDRWIDDLSDDAAFNFSSYAECFISENLVRKYINEKNVTLSKEAQDEVKKYKKIEADSKNNANISIEIRRKKDDLNYLDMKNLANLIDKVDRISAAGLSRDALEFKPMRDAVAHTSLLSDAAKTRLAAVRENIRARIKTLLAKP